MPPLISSEYIEINKRLHDDDPSYGDSAHSSAAGVVSICRLNSYKKVLDYGCGKGSLKIAMARLAPEIEVLEFDPAIGGKDTLPTERIDFLVALDVMEHIEPSFLPDVLSTMRDLKPQTAMLVISTKPANKTLADGRNAHLIVEPGAWWIEKLSHYFTALSSRESEDHVLYVGAPK